MQRATAEVTAIGQLNISGNVTPQSWFTHLKRANGKPHATAVILLSEIVYWYRPTEVRDEETGNVIGYKRKFKADLLQRSYDSFANQFGFTKRQVKDALKFLEDAGIITLVFRTIKLDDGRKLNNVLYIRIWPDKLRDITYAETEPLSQNNVIGVSKECQTNTETTTETTTERKDTRPVAEPPKPPTEADLMFVALAQLCEWNPNLVTKPQRGQLNQNGKILRDKARASPDDLKAFQKWWYEYDWRGKKGDPPQPHLVRENWQRFDNWRKGLSHSDNGRRPATTRKERSIAAAQAIIEQEEGQWQP